MNKTQLDEKKLSDEVNILDKIKLSQAVRLAERKQKEGKASEAAKIYRDILKRFPKNPKAIAGITKISSTNITKGLSDEQPPKRDVQRLIDQYSRSQFEDVINSANRLLITYPKSATLYNVLGAALKAKGNPEEAIVAYDRALYFNPDFPDVLNNMGNALKEMGRLNEAVEFYKRAIGVKSDYAEAFFNLGTTLKDLDELVEAIAMFKTAISFKPKYTSAYNNMGTAQQDLGMLNEALSSFERVLSIDPLNAVAYENIGNVLLDKGQKNSAISAYEKALELNPNAAAVYHNLSTVIQYTQDHPHIYEAEKIYKSHNISNEMRSRISFALAKMYEDSGALDQSFKYLSEGNRLRRKVLNYSIEQDEKLFAKLKNMEGQIRNVKIGNDDQPSKITPIFIVGMPRSGTTLVEQIVSSHSEVTGGGELNFVGKHSFDFLSESKTINSDNIQGFRTKYLTDLEKVSVSRKFVTDKMPHNFRYIPLICAAFPEAKIIHVRRDASATCWSNFKHYFTTKGLGYSHDLQDTVKYYHLYSDLMDTWQSRYGDRIYNLDYDELTIEQENAIKKLIENLGLNWQDACLAPQKNKRSVATASQMQVRKRIYRGSSAEWKKFTPYLKGVFDSFINL